MKNYKNYIFERNDTQIISDDEFKKLIKENCQEFLNDPKPIYRSLAFTTDNYLMVDPKKFNRKSLSGDNFYNLIIDETWKDYPKRSQSICCSTTSINIDYFGNFFYFVIPFDNSKWGICPELDMWSSFKLYNQNIIHFCDIYDRLNAELLNQYSSINTIKTIEEFKHNADILCEEFKRQFGDEDISSLSYSSWLYSLCNIVNNNVDFIDDLRTGNLYNEIVNGMNPIKNNFTVGSYKDIIFPLNDTDFKAQREIWTDSKCLLKRFKYRIDDDYNKTFQKFLTEINT